MPSRRHLLLTGAAAALTAGCSGENGSASSITLPSSGVAGDGFRLEGINSVTRIAQLTGPGAINDTQKVLLAGTDLGNMFKGLISP